MKKGTYYLTRQRQKEKQATRQPVQPEPVDPLEGKNLMDISSAKDEIDGIRVLQDLDTGDVYRQYLSDGSICAYQKRKAEGKLSYYIPGRHNEPKER